MGLNAKAMSEIICSDKACDLAIESTKVEGHYPEEWAFGGKGEV